MAHYKFTIGGDYYIKEAGGKAIRNYEIEVNVPLLPDPNASDTRYLTIIKKNLLNKIIKNRYPGAVSYRTHEIIDKVLIDENQSDKPRTSNFTVPKPPSKMNKTELLSFIKMNNLPINLELYFTVDSMKKAIAKYNESPDAFLKKQEEEVSELEMKKLLTSLNPTAQPVVEITEETTENEQPTK